MKISLFALAEEGLQLNSARYQGSLPVLRSGFPSLLRVDLHGKVWMVRGTFREGKVRVNKRIATIPTMKMISALSMC